MFKPGVLITALVFAGCASTPTPQEEAAFQRELPQVVASCNQFAQRKVPFASEQACDRLADRKLLSLADPAAVRNWHYVKNLSLASPVGSLR